MRYTKHVFGRRATPLETPGNRAAKESTLGCRYRRSIGVSCTRISALCPAATTGRSSHLEPPEFSERGAHSQQSFDRQPVRH